MMMHPYNCIVYSTDSCKLLLEKIKWACSLRRKSNWQKFYVVLVIASSIKAELLKDAERAWLSPSSILVPSVSPPRAGKVPRASSSVSDSARAARFGIFLLPTEIVEIPPSSSREHSVQCGVQRTRVCKLLGVRRHQQNVPCLCRGVKTCRLLFQSSPPLEIWRRRTEH